MPEHIASYKLLFVKRPGTETQGKALHGAKGLPGAASNVGPSGRQAVLFFDWVGPHSSLGSVVPTSHYRLVSPLAAAAKGGKVLKRRHAGLAQSPQRPCPILPKRPTDTPQKFGIQCFCSSRPLD